MQGHCLGNDRDLALEPCHLTTDPVQSFTNEPFGPWRRSQKTLKRRLDDHALADSPAFGRGFKPLQDAFGELNDDLLGSQTFVRARLHLAIGTIPNRAGLTFSLSIDLHCFFSSSIATARNGTRYPCSVAFLSKQMNRPSDDAWTEGPIRPRHQSRRHRRRSLA